MATANNTSLPEEQWKPIPGWEGFYSASDHGRVRSHSRIVERGIRPMKLQERILKPGKERHGHHFYNLNRNGEVKTVRVHRLVIEVFNGPIPEGLVVCHNDGDPSNNKLSNLRVDTQSSNMLDCNEHGTFATRKRTHCPRGHILAEPNLSPWHFKRGRRVCLACSRTHGYSQFSEERKRDFKRISDSYYDAIMRDAA